LWQLSGHLNIPVCPWQWQLYLATHIRLLFLAQLFFAFAFRVTRFNGTEELAQSTWLFCFKYW